MAEENESNESRVLGISVRGWITVILTIAVCVLSVIEIQIRGTPLLCLSFGYRILFWAENSHLMSSFTCPLVVRKLKKNLWMIERALIYHVGGEDSGDSITVPKGFVTDFASVPRILWAVFPPDGTYTAAAVLHDYLYSTQERTREVSDLIFLEAMEVLGVSAWKRGLMYQAVHWFGWIGWRRKVEKYGLDNKEARKES